MAEQALSPTCAQAVAAALGDLREWYSACDARDSTGFGTYLRQSYKVVSCGTVEGVHISVMLRQPVRRGGGDWYVIETESFGAVERVFGRYR
jgi:hypothetical protein